MAENKLFSIALNKAMSVCSKSEFCRADIYRKLSSWGVEKNDSEKIIGVLIKENFINELRYSLAFVSDKFKYNKWGKVKIAAHLRAKNLPSDLISSALDSIDNEQYIKMIRELIDNHRRTVKAKNPYELKAKLLRYGLTKGFESSLLYEMLNDLED
jgi:regulatory protein